MFSQLTLYKKLRNLPQEFKFPPLFNQQEYLSYTSLTDLAESSTNRLKLWDCIQQYYDGEPPARF